MRTEDSQTKSSSIKNTGQPNSQRQRTAKQALPESRTEDSQTSSASIKNTGQPNSQGQRTAKQALPQSRTQDNQTVKDRGQPNKLCLNQEQWTTSQQQEDSQTSPSWVKDSGQPNKLCLNQEQWTTSQQQEDSQTSPSWVKDSGQPNKLFLSQGHRTAKSSVKDRGQANLSQGQRTAKCSVKDRWQMKKLFLSQRQMAAKCSVKDRWHMNKLFLKQGQRTAKQALPQSQTDTLPPPPPPPPPPACGTGFPTKRLPFAPSLPANLTLMAAWGLLTEPTLFNTSLTPFKKKKGKKKSCDSLLLPTHTASFTTPGPHTRAPWHITLVGGYHTTGKETLPSTKLLLPDITASRLGIMNRSSTFSQILYSGAVSVMCNHANVNQTLSKKPKERFLHLKQSWARSSAPAHTAWLLSGLSARTPVGLTAPHRTVSHAVSKN